MLLKIKKFFKVTLLGGVMVLLPVILTFFFLRWFIDLVTGLINPLTRLLVEKSHVQKSIADILVVAIIVLVCFMVGVLIKTKLGIFIHGQIEKKILKIAPGYSLFRETIKQFLGQERAPFSSVALVRVFENSTMMTAFITDEHPDGSYTVYVPSGLNPTTGLIFHLQKEFVHQVEASVETTMRSIIGCGAGSGQLIESYMKKSKQGGSLGLE
jgi:uncharacterized membrane protein